MQRIASNESAQWPRFALDQGRLDISSRSRTSRLPWRGQFSPEFIEYVIDEICPDADVIYDPFCGSGTVLFEALQRSKSAFGAEVNPAAWHLAALSSFADLGPADQAKIVSEIRRYATAASSSGMLFEQEAPAILDGLSDDASHPFLRLALAAVVLVGMGNGTRLDSAAIARGSFAILSVLAEIAEARGRAGCLLADARHTLLPPSSVDAVITSPPYINVFNYHQNYRPAAELLGWQPLQAAASEIGANRKHRQNRFLTVTQYVLDMAECLAETARVMKVGSPLTIVLGRTSNVLGASFKNGEIIASVIDCIGAFGALHKAERSFTNRFGERIYEDIIIAQRGLEEPNVSTDRLRQIGVRALMNAREMVPEKNRAVLHEAIDKAMTVQSSPLLAISIPAPFKENPNGKSEKNGSHSHRRTR